MPVLGVPRPMKISGWLVVLFYGISTLFGSFNVELSHFDKGPCRLGLENTPTASLERDKIPPMSVLDMTLNKKSCHAKTKMI